MLKKYHLNLILLLFPALCFGQTVYNDPETVSYNWYIQANWDSLLTNRNKLLNNGNDYYFMRYRLGEAAYRTGKYRQAATDFARAAALNSNDSFSTSFYAHSLLLAGRFSEAILIGKNLRKQKSTNAQYYKSVQLNSMYCEYGNKFSSDKNISGNLSFFQVATGLQVLPSANLFVAFSSLVNSNYYSEVKQKIYFTKLKLQLKNAWSLEPYFNYIDASVGFYPTKDYPFTYSYYLQNQVVGLNVLKSFSKWDINFGGTYSNLSNNTQIQANTGLTFYPKANNSLFAALQLTYHNENDGSNNSQNLLIRPSAGFKLAKNLWFTSEFYYGNAYNFVENSGYLVNNAVDLTKWRLNSGLQYYPSKMFSFFLTYQHEARQEKLFSSPYSLNSIFIGIRYNPWSR